MQQKLPCIRYYHYLYVIYTLFILILAEYLQKKWGTRLLSDLSHFGSLVLVELPFRLQVKDRPPVYSDAEIIQNALHHKYKIEVRSFIVISG